MFPFNYFIEFMIVDSRWRTS